MIEKFNIRTGGKEGMHDITEQVRSAVANSEVQNGIAIIFSPHTTAGITINENADRDVQTDMLHGFDKAFPDRTEFRHAEGNSTAHLKTSTVGESVTVIIEGGKLLLGIWQGIYFCEFDGPRNRTYYIKIIEG